MRSTAADQEMPALSSFGRADQGTRQCRIESFEQVTAALRIAKLGRCVPNRAMAWPFWDAPDWSIRTFLQLR